MGRLCAKLAAAKAKEVCAGKQKDMFCYSFSFSSSLYPCLRDIMSLLLSNADRASDVEFPGYFHFEERNCSTIVTLTTNHLFFRPLLCVLHISKNNPPAPYSSIFLDPKNKYTGLISNRRAGQNLAPTRRSQNGLHLWKQNGLSVT